MHYKTAILLGIWMWLIVLIVSLFVSGTCGCVHYYFEPFMPISLVTVATFASAFYFRNVTRHHVFSGIHIGILWLGINLLLDAIFLTLPPMRILLWEYLRHIGMLYLVVLIIPICFEYAFAKKKKD